MPLPKRPAKRLRSRSRSDQARRKGCAQGRSQTVAGSRDGFEAPPHDEEDREGRARRNDEDCRKDRHRAGDCRPQIDGEDAREARREEAPRQKSRNRSEAPDGPRSRRVRRARIQALQPPRTRRNALRQAQALRARHQRADPRSHEHLQLRRARRLPAHDRARRARQPQEGHERRRTQRAFGESQPRSADGAQRTRSDTGRAALASGQQGSDGQALL